MVDTGLRATPRVPAQRSLDCPYRGLMPYTEEDAEFFFGRDADSRLIVDNLRAYSLSVLFGPSGVGKSSVLRAGVLRLVREDTARKKARFGIVETAAAYVSSWRDDPRRSLPGAVAAALGAATGQDPGLPTDRLDCAAIVESCGRLGIDLLLILDQFEEYFLYHGDDDTGLARILQELLQPGSRVSVLIAIREDALARLDDLEWALPGVFDHTLRLEHLDREAAREAILEPVAHFNSRMPENARWEVEPELVDALLDQVAAGRVRVARQVDVPDDERSVAHGQIEAPFLQLVLLRLWSEESAQGSQRLQLATLERLGGAEHIVREHLDRVVSAFPPGDHPVLAAVFGQLVTPGGTKIAHSASDLAGLTGIDEGHVRQVLHRLCQGDQRILREVHPPGDDPGAESRFEVFHDVLALAVIDWRRRWLTARAQEEAHRAVVAEKEQAESQAHETRRRLKRARILLGTMGLLVIICAAAVVWGIWKNNQVSEARDASQQSLSIAQAQRQFAVDPSRSLDAVLTAWRATGGGDRRDDLEEMLRRSFSAADASLRVKLGDAPVGTAVFTRDGSRLMTASQDGHVRLVDVESGKVTQDIDLGPTLDNARFTTAVLVDDEQAALVGTRDGAAVLAPLDGSEPTVLRAVGLAGWTDPLVPVSGSREVALTLGLAGNRAVVWNLGTHRQISSLGSGDEYIGAAALSHDGAYAATWGWQGDLRIWRTSTGAQVASARVPRDSAPFLLFSQNAGRALALVTGSGTGKGLSVWDWRHEAAPDKPSDLAVRHDVNWVGLDPAGQHLMVAKDKTTLVFDLQHRKSTSSSPARDWTDKAAVSPDGRLLATATNDGQVLLDYADRENAHPLWSFSGHGAPVLDVSFSPSGDRIVSSASDGSVRVWRVPERLVDWGATESSEWLLDARFTRTGHEIVVGSESGQVHFADAATGKVTWRAPAFSGGQLSSVDPSPDGTSIVAAGSRTASPFVVRRDDRTAPKLRPGDLRGNVIRARWSPNPDVPLIVGAAAYSNEVAVWDAAKGGAPRWITKLGTKDAESVWDVEFDADADAIVATSTDGGLHVLDPETGTITKTLHVGDANAVAVSSDGRFAATAGDDQTVRVWDLDSPGKKPLHTLTAPAGTVGEVNFSQDESSVHLAAVSSDGHTYVWSRKSGQLLAALTRHSDAVNAVDFDPQNPDRVVTASDDGTASVYSCTPCDLDAKELDKAAEERLAVRSSAGD